ncbi:MAG: fasciclin domain-containing protein, partial [Actinobacteria bacterium]|nr:fasciclin domain-containing protein [Actinomycetota bacterium]
MPIIETIERRARRPLAMVALLVVAAGLLAACGGNDDSPSGAAESRGNAADGHEGASTPAEG